MGNRIYFILFLHSNIFQAISLNNNIKVVELSIDMMYKQGTSYGLYFIKIEKTKYTRNTAHVPLVCCDVFRPRPCRHLSEV